MTDGGPLPMSDGEIARVLRLLRFVAGTDAETRTLRQFHWALLELTRRRHTIRTGGVRMEGCCATCAFWQRNHEEERGECEAMSVDHTGRPIHPDSKAHAEPGSTATWALVRTAPDFGCVQYVKEA